MLKIIYSNNVSRRFFLPDGVLEHLMKDQLAHELDASQI